MALNCRSLDVSNRPFRFYMNSACNKLTYTSCQQRATKFASSFFSNERYCFLGVPTGHRHNWIQTTSTQKLVKPETYPGSTQGPRVHSRIVLINDYSSSGFSLDPVRFSERLVETSCWKRISISVLLTPVCDQVHCRESPAWQ